MGPIANAFVAGFNALILSGQPGPPPQGLHAPRAHRPAVMAPLPRPRPEMLASAETGVAAGVPEAIGGAPRVAGPEAGARAEPAARVTEPEDEAAIAGEVTGPVDMAMSAAGDEAVRAHARDTVTGAAGLAEVTPPAAAARARAGDAVDAAPMEMAAAGDAAAGPELAAAGVAEMPPVPVPRPAEGDAEIAEPASVPVEVAAPADTAEGGAAAAAGGGGAGADGGAAPAGGLADGPAVAAVDAALGGVVEPVPRPRPAQVADDPEQGALVDPIPRPRPEGGAEGAAVDGAAAEGEAAADAAAPGHGTTLASLGPAEPPAESLTPEGGPRYALVADGACLAALDRLQVVREQLPAIENGFCGLGTPLKVSAIGAEDGLKLAPAATLDCATAVALAEWLDGVVEPAALAALEAPVTGIRIADSYSCRGRNNVAGTKMSEHSFGHAVDIGAFEVGGEWIAVAALEDEAAPEAEFLAAVRSGACAHFTTVLGPGQPYHDDHLHLDLGRHGRNGTGRICE